MFKLFHYLALIFQAISVIIIPANGDWPSGTTSYDMVQAKTTLIR
jgi:hypothetical protein